MQTTLQQTHFCLWEDALLTGNPSTVADLYASDFTLLPTLAADVVTSRQALEGYFTNFLALQPKASIVEEHVSHLGPEHYLHAGIYKFDIVKDGEKDCVEARFSYVWRKIDGEWKILHHHSSLLPS